MSNVIVLFKRWWLLAVVFTLALSLTSCARKNVVVGGNYGFCRCDDPAMGAFDLWILPSKNASGMYEISIIPFQVNNGDIVKITVANQSLSYKEMVSQVVLMTSQEVFGGYLTAADIQNYNILAITPYSQATFLDQNPTKAVFCQMPQPGEVIERCQQY